MPLRMLWFLYAIIEIAFQTATTQGVSVRVKGNRIGFGRIEILHNGKWGTVCDDHWNLNDAKVVCRQLGFRGAKTALQGGDVPAGTGQIWLDDVVCTGSEQFLANCSHTGWGIHNCIHSEDAGVHCDVPGIDECKSGNTSCHQNATCRYTGGSFGCVCHSGYWGNGTSCEEVALRLQGPFAKSGVGRVEIFYNGRWGTVCDDSWDLNDAKVVCRQLGFPGAKAALQGRHVPDGTGYIWLDEVACTGNEKILASCPHYGWGTHDCTHYEDAGVHCDMPGSDECKSGNTSCHPNATCIYNEGSFGCVCDSGYWGNGTSCEEIAVRLQGPFANSGEGRVEIFFNGKWGTICDDSWNLVDAKVVCRQLGFPGAKTALQGHYVPDGKGQIWLDDVTCIGSEQFLSNCYHRRWGLHNCGHNEDAGVRCVLPDIDECSLGLDNCGNYSQCVNTNTSFICVCNVGYSGNGIVCKDFNECSTRMDNCDDNAQCSNTVGSFACKCNVGYYGNGTDCNDTDECVSGTANCHQNATCRNTEGSFVCTCDHGYFGNGTVCEEIPVRLQGPFTKSGIGRVEIFYNGKWGTVCDDSWDLNDAKVVCRQLGFPGAKAALQGRYIPDGTGQIWLDDVTCIGSEKTFATCRHREWGKHNCKHNEDAGVHCGVPDIDECKSGATSCHQNATCRYIGRSFGCVCDSGYWGNGTSCEEIAVRLQGPFAKSGVGRVEIFYKGKWGTVCDDYWNLNNAKVVCRQLGFPGAKTALQGYYVPDGTGQIWLDDVTCFGSEQFIGNCLHREWGSHDCGHNEDAGVQCVASDIDECSLGLDNCDINSQCVDTNDSFICICNVGYSGNGVICNDIDECVNKTICHSNSLCKNMPGTHVCSCYTGFTGNSTNCTDIDECNTGVANCDKNAICKNTAGSFSCTCENGYSGNGTVCQGEKKTASTGRTQESQMSKPLSPPDIAYLVGGLVLAIAIIVLIIFISLRRRSNGGHDDTVTVLENMAYEQEDRVVDDFSSEKRSAINTLYMTKEKCQDSRTKENSQPLNDVTEC